MNRRKFIIQGGMTAGALLLNGSSFASSSTHKLTILHTNDDDDYRPTTSPSCTQ
jgi:hypothetical protein